MTNPNTSQIGYRRLQQEGLLLGELEIIGEAPVASLLDASQLHTIHHPSRDSICAHPPHLLGWEALMIRLLLTSPTSVTTASEADRVSDRSCNIYQKAHSLGGSTNGNDGIIYAKIPIHRQRKKLLDNHNHPACHSLRLTTNRTISSWARAHCFAIPVVVILIPMTRALRYDRN